MNSIKNACDCHVYNSKYDQAFVGYSKEGEPRYGQFWKAAVDSTVVDESRGLAITINELPVSVFFSSSSGGMTQRPIDVWGTSIPHLVSVPDPWSIDPAVNKNFALWRKKVSQRVMAKGFGLPDVIELKLGERTATNSVLDVTAISSDGTSKTLPVGTFKTAVKLPSSWFELTAQN
jgi:SpoIID/LytB domain protein